MAGIYYISHPYNINIAGMKKLMLIIAMLAIRTPFTVLYLAY